MIKNLKLFLKSLSFSDVLFKIFILFLAGVFLRFLVNNFFDFSFFVELISFLSIPLFINSLSFINPVDPGSLKDNITSFKGLRERVMNTDYEIKDRLRRKCHWVFLKQFSSDFKDYNDFKNYWNSDKKYINLLKSEYYDKKEKIILFKKTLSYFINRKYR